MKSSQRDLFSSQRELSHRDIFSTVRGIRRKWLILGMVIVGLLSWEMACKTGNSLLRKHKQQLDFESLNLEPVVANDFSSHPTLDKIGHHVDVVRWEPEQALPYNESEPLTEASFSFWRYDYLNIGDWSCDPAKHKKIVILEMGGHFRTMAKNAPILRAWLDSLGKDVCWFATLATWAMVDTIELSQHRLVHHPKLHRLDKAQARNANQTAINYMDEVNSHFGGRLATAIVADELFEIGEGKTRQWQLWRVAHDLAHFAITKAGGNYKDFLDKTIVIRTRPDILFSHSLNLNKFFDVLSPDVQQFIGLAESINFIGKRDPSDMFWITNLAGQCMLVNRMMQSPARIWLRTENMLYPKKESNGVVQIGFLPPTFGLMIHRIVGNSNILPRDISGNHPKVDFGTEFGKGKRMNLNDMQCVQAHCHITPTRPCKVCKGFKLNGKGTTQNTKMGYAMHVPVDKCFQDGLYTKHCGSEEFSEE